MNKKIFLMLVLFSSMFILVRNVEAEPILNNPYIIPTDENNNVEKEVPLNLVNLEYVGKDISKDVLINGVVPTSLILYPKSGDNIIIKNMGTYQDETIDLNLTIIVAPTSLVIYRNGKIKLEGALFEGQTKFFRINVYRHNTTILYPNLYVGYFEKISTGFANFESGELFGYQNLYGIYLPKELNLALQTGDIKQGNGVLDLRYGKTDPKDPYLLLYPIFNNSSTGFIRGKSLSGSYTNAFNIEYFDPTNPSPIPLPYNATTTLINEKETTDLKTLDITYIVTQKLANYLSPWQYPSDNSFKIKTNFERTSLENFPVEVEVKLADNQVIDKKYYSTKTLGNRHEVIFSTDFLKEYKGSIVTVEYKQHIDGDKVNFADWYNTVDEEFNFPFSSENEWERQGESYKQKEPSVGQSKVKFAINLNTTILNGKKVIQYKSTDDYNPSDFISNINSNIPKDNVRAFFTKKVVFENRGEQEIYITLKSSSSSATKDIVLKVEVIEGTIHFTETPSGLSFPPIELTGKVEDYEIESFSEGILSVLDDRLTKSPWSLTAVLTENKTMNNYRDILYFRNEEGEVYNITNQTQNVMTNRNLDSTKTIIDYEKNKNIGLFLRINPLLVKKGKYEGVVMWSLVDAPS